MRCAQCGRWGADPPDNPETVTVGPVTLNLTPRMRQAAIIGARWSLGIMAVFGMILMDIIVFDRALWPVGLVIIALQIGVAAALFWYLQPELFS